VKEWRKVYILLLFLFWLFFWFSLSLSLKPHSIVSDIFNDGQISFFELNHTERMGESKKRKLFFFAFRNMKWTHKTFKWSASTNEFETFTEQTLSLLFCGLNGIHKITKKKENSEWILWRREMFWVKPKNFVEIRQKKT
jgi:hypothetical protein